MTVCLLEHMAYCKNLIVQFIVAVFRIKLLKWY